MPEIAIRTGHFTWRILHGPIGPWTASRAKAALFAHIYWHFLPRSDGVTCAHRHVSHASCSVAAAALIAPAAVSFARRIGQYDD